MFFYILVNLYVVRKFSSFAFFFEKIQEIFFLNVGSEMCAVVYNLYGN